MHQSLEVGRGKKNKYGVSNKVSLFIYEIIMTDSLEEILNDKPCKQKKQQVPP